VCCTHCNTLQHTATHGTHCNTLHYTAAYTHASATHCNTLQHTATHCNTLQHTATHCNTLQHTYMLQYNAGYPRYYANGIHVANGTSILRLLLLLTLHFNLQHKLCVRGYSRSRSDAGILVLVLYSRSCVFAGILVPAHNGNENTREHTAARIQNENENTREHTAVCSRVFSFPRTHSLCTRIPAKTQLNTLRYYTLRS